MNCEDTKNRIVHWLSDQLKQADLDAFVVGVSGGVDSALTSTLAAKTGATVYAMSMPVGKTSEGDHRANQHLDDLNKRYPNVRTLEVRIDEIVDSFDHILWDSMPWDEIIDDGLVSANAQSRLRMVMLYAVANHRDGMVVGTGNKVEDEGVGFFTKFGDGGVDVSPICDLYKSEVRELADHLDVREEIVNATPTDGLWEDNRSDEEQLGISYDELELFMHLYENPDFDKESLVGKAREKYETFVEMHENTRHKMNTPPMPDLSDVKYE